jgi:C4-dicarboxylate transporter, DctM subunit
MSEPLATDVPNPKAARLAFTSIGAVVAALGALGGSLVAMVAALALLGTPLFAVMAGAAELAWLTHPDPEQQVLRRLASEVFGSRFAGSPILTTIPLFTFVGYAMAESKTPERLVRAATAWVGWMPGGLAIVCVLASAVFTLFTGGSGVTIIAVGGLLLPALRQKGYSERFSLGLVTTGGSLGLLLPYALPLLVYAMVTGLDFQLVNKAVIAPGAFVLVLLAVYCAYVGVKEQIPTSRFDAREALAATWDFKWEIGVFAVLVLSIATQLASIDEAAGLVALYTLFIEVFVYKDLSIKKDVVRIAKASMALAGAVILILAMANALVNYVVQERLPDKVLEAMLRVGLDKTWQFLIVMNVFLLVLGMIMDGFSAILVAVPLVLPFAAHFGLGPFHVAIMFVLNLELAFSCPPLGLNLFISSFRFNRPVVSLYRVALPFVALLALALVVITYVPRISNVLVLSDIAEWRARAERENRTPSEAWFLECVQLDRNNPEPCSAADREKYPNGQMPNADSTADAGEAPRETSEDDDDLSSIISGEDAGAKPAPIGESDEDLSDLIRSGAEPLPAPSSAPAPVPSIEPSPPTPPAPPKPKIKPPPPKPTKTTEPPPPPPDEAP